MAPFRRLRVRTAIASRPRPFALRLEGERRRRWISSEALPEGLLSLLTRSERLHERVLHLDRRMYLLESPGDEAPNPVLSQFERLRDAYGGRRAAKAPPSARKISLSPRAGGDPGFF